MVDASGSRAPLIFVLLTLHSFPMHSNGTTWQGQALILRQVYSVKPSGVTAKIAHPLQAGVFRFKLTKHSMA